MSSDDCELGENVTHLAATDAPRGAVVSVRLSAEDAMALAMFAELRGQRLSDVVREAIRSHIGLSASTTNSLWPYTVTVTGVSGAWVGV